VPHDPSLGVDATNCRARFALEAHNENFDGRAVPAVWLPKRVSESEMFQQVILGIFAAAALEA
jgi:hypothetical protein